MKKKNKNKESNIKLAVYFGILVLIIIVISIVFKTVDLIKESKFDGSNRFTISLDSDKGVDLISVSPEDGTLTRLLIKNIKKNSDLDEYSIPINSYGSYDKDADFSSKRIFLKMLVNPGKIRSDLSVVDLIRLSIFEIGVSGEKISKNEAEGSDNKKIFYFSSMLFTDPVIIDEKKSIKITNSTKIFGLGNQLARYITNLGGNVLLVNSSQELLEKSKIIIKEESYTSRRLSKWLKIPIQKGGDVSISDIYIVIGEDYEEIRK